VALRDLSTDTLILACILYGCLPLWVIMGFADYLCHRRSEIEYTSGARESILHIIMGAQIGIPVFLGLYFEINVLLLLLAFAILMVHEWFAHQDVRYALHRREISLAEMHVHSFLEVLPFVVVLLIIVKRWPAFVALITLDWGGQLALVPKAIPVESSYIAAYFAFMMVAGVAPYIEEFRRWRRAPRRPVRLLQEEQA
jgi:hypothetical protein